jgi:hypothetical protein
MMAQSLTDLVLPTRVRGTKAHPRFRLNEVEIATTTKWDQLVEVLQKD